MYRYTRLITSVLQARKGQVKIEGFLPINNNVTINNNVNRSQIACIDKQVEQLSKQQDGSCSNFEAQGSRLK